MIEEVNKRRRKEAGQILQQRIKWTVLPFLLLSWMTTDQYFFFLSSFFLLSLFKAQRQKKEEERVERGNNNGGKLDWMTSLFLSFTFLLVSIQFFFSVGRIFSFLCVEETVSFLPFNSSGLTCFLLLLVQFNWME